MIGSQIIQSDCMVDEVRDWSKCRSPSRARRRHARGIRTRMEIRFVPSTRVLTIDDGRTLVMHPETYRQARAMLDNFAKEWSGWRGC